MALAGGVDGVQVTKSPLPLHLEARPIGTKVSKGPATDVAYKDIEPMSVTLF